MFTLPIWLQWIVAIALLVLGVAGFVQFAKQVPTSVTQGVSNEQSIRLCVIAGIIGFVWSMVLIFK